MYTGAVTIPFAVFLCMTFAVGLAAGSFINVCVYRMPRDESVVFPGSHCPSCGAAIRWFDNIPLASYIILGGACRSCNARISLRYPCLELLTGILFLLVAWRFPLQGALLPYLLLTFILIVVSGIDTVCQLIPDVFSWALIAGGLGLSIINEPLGMTPAARFGHALAGGLAGGCILLIIGYLGEKAYGKEAMGGGDVKLLAGIGTILGIAKVFAVLFIASFLAAAVGLTLIVMKRITRRAYIPFGPFLAAGAYLSIFLPDPVTILYNLRIMPPF